jgi:hypothetical protein
VNEDGSIIQPFHNWILERPIPNNTPVEYPNLPNHNVADAHILLLPPVDYNRFLTRLREVKQFRRGEHRDETMENYRVEENRTVDDHRIYRSHWLNNIITFKDIIHAVDELWQTEKHRGIVKMTIDFGIITETAERTDNHPQPIYSAIRPTQRSGFLRAPIIVDSNRVEMLKEYIINEIRNIQDYRGAENSNTKYIAIYNICINVYNLMEVGASDPILSKIISSNFGFSYSGKYNIYWFAIGVYEEHFRTNSKKIDHKALESRTKEEWRDFVYRDNDEIRNLSTKSPRLQKLLSEYRGFNLIDLEEYQRWKNYNIRVFNYNIQTNRYTLSMEYNHPNPNENTKVVNVAIITRCDGQKHTIYIKDVEKATGLVLCPKCKYAVFDLHRNKQEGSNSRYSRHLKECDGKIHKEKKLIVQKDNYPYIPHISQNPTYKYLLAHERENEFKPRQYYITFDFETMEKLYTKSFGKNNASKILSIVEPLSIAACVKTKNYVKTIYKDIRDGKDFITQWMEIIFEEAEQVMKDNAYEDPNIPFDNFVPVIGFNSGRFDLNLLLKYLHNPPHWCLKKCMGDNAFKMMMVEKGCDDNELEENDEDNEFDSGIKTNKIQLKFLDLLNYVSPSTLDKVVKDFTDEKLKKNEMKGCFAYEAFNNENVFDVLSSEEPFTRKDFYSYLKKKEMSEDEYKAYVNDWNDLKKNGTVKNRWDYLKYYNIQDTQIMLKPTDYLINNTFTGKVDMLHNLTLASCAASLKYSYTYKDFDLRNNYSDEKGIKEFQITREWLKMKCDNYNEQDKKAERPIDKNVTVKDFQAVLNLYESQNFQCAMCGRILTNEKPPTFDRINNFKSHTLANIKITCCDCNRARGDRDFYNTRLNIKLKQFAEINKYPIPPNDEKVINQLQRGITGGLSNVLHRKNIAGETHINKFYYDAENKKVISKDLPSVVTHITGIDFNSLYPSVYSSTKNELIEYTDHRMMMPGKIMNYYCGEEHKTEMMSIINGREELFIASIKAHIPEERYNEFINFPPIFRNMDVSVSDTKKERKLTQLLSTMNQYMEFTNYYLWYLIDRCGLIIDDVQELTTFTKHKGFENFVSTFMGERMEAIQNENTGKDKYCKMILNAAFGKDGMNTANYNKTHILNTNAALLKHTSPNFMSDRQVSDDLYTVSMSPSTYSIKTPLQCAVWTLDNAKYWYIKLYYDLLIKVFDENKFHFNEGDTDSGYYSISGDPNDDYTQGFKHIIKNKELYDQIYHKWFPNPAKAYLNKKGKISYPPEEEKKLLGLTVEKEGTEMICVAPKCYFITNIGSGKGIAKRPADHRDKQTMKVKGVSLGRNKITKEDYEAVVEDRKIIKGANCGFHIKDVEGMKYMVKLETEKNAITPTHNKMVCLSNHACAPFVEGLNRDDYVVEVSPKLL